MEPIFKMTLPGRPIVLKNSKRVIARGRGKRAIVLPSDRYREWEEIAMAVASGAANGHPIDHPIEAKYKFYFATRQAESDVSNLLEGPGDIMQKAGIIKNDKLIMRVSGEKFFGHEPRTEIEIFKYEPTTL